MQTIESTIAQYGTPVFQRGDVLLWEDKKHGGYYSYPTESEIEYVQKDVIPAMLAHIAGLEQEREALQKELAELRPRYVQVTEIEKPLSNRLPDFKHIPPPPPTEEGTLDALIREHGQREAIGNTINRPSLRIDSPEEFRGLVPTEEQRRNSMGKYDRRKVSTEKGRVPLMEGWFIATPKPYSPLLWLPTLEEARTKAKDYKACYYGLMKRCSVLPPANFIPLREAYYAAQ